MTDTVTLKLWNDKTQAHDFDKEVKALSPQLFLDAADILERDGKISGSYYRDNKDKTGCSFCTAGAIAYAAGIELKKIGGGYTELYGIIQYMDYLDTQPLIKEFVKTAIGQDDGVVGEIFCWSDRTPQDEVIATLRKFGNEQKEKAS